MRVPCGAWCFVGACAAVVNESVGTQVVAFFEERRGQLYGLRWCDRLGHSSVAPGLEASSEDQLIGLGDGTRTEFQLMKTYGSPHAPYARPIAKPVVGSVRIAVDGIEAEDRFR